MNKIKFFALLAFSAMFFACGSQDGSPPELKNSQLGAISPFDTLRAEFNSEIVDIDKLDSSNIVSRQDVGITCYGSCRELLFTGVNTTPGGARYFSHTARDSIVFKKITNSDGYTTKNDLVLYFSTIPILDDIENHSNSSEAHAKDLDPFLTEITGRSVEFAGVLDHKISGNIFNMEDYYKLSLRMSDVIKITAKARDTLNVTLTEPGRNSVNQTFGVKKGGSEERSYTIGSGHLDIDSGDPSNKLVDFIIKVSDDNPSAPPNPYTLLISVSRP
ncbi:MAG: hypothetical protein LBC85_00170 [Fibromonadaceae bacterium]|nr:hypothetical protein [Fibromonadaceae bacterium]